jgi:hypothetical protein
MVTTPELIAIRRGQIRQLVEAGSTAPEIAHELNLRTTIVTSDLRALRLKPAKARHHSRTAERNDELAAQIRKMAAAGTKRSATAQTLGISYSVLCNIMTTYTIPKPVRRPEHGTVKEYRSYDCRCTPCTSANAEETARARAVRKSRLSPDSLVHGTPSGYTNHLCRCLPCTEAGAKFYASHRKNPSLRSRRNWTADEDTAVLDYNLTAKELSILLDRPIPSITSRRTSLRKKGAEVATIKKRSRGAQPDQVRLEASAAPRAEVHLAEARAKAKAGATARLAAATESRRGAIASLVDQGLSRAQIMFTLDIDYETLQTDLRHLGLTPSRAGIQRENTTCAAPVRVSMGDHGHRKGSLARAA